MLLCYVTVWYNYILLANKIKHNSLFEEKLYHLSCYMFEPIIRLSSGENNTKYVLFLPEDGLITGWNM